MARKVAIYARVSTEHEAQISALENQVQYYGQLRTGTPAGRLKKVLISKVFVITHHLWNGN